MKQCGYNSAYPEIIEAWKIGSSTLIPSWLSPLCKVRIGEKSAELVTRDTSSGGLELLSSDGLDVLLVTKGKNDWICFGSGRIFSLTPEQLELLYEE